ncbi:ROK family transcriptional regulator [Microbacterium sp. KSW4-11]|uniref:ROK family transcriptional regulator n=1 Tax=Microbacterium gawkjiense TaxID=3067309 RepID=A0ABU3G9A2_9MICO|nr:ROK family transcriptional regulator [Microbacterium sp. KSW4-11]MDT3316389.1 ROK family transcriptional regulator [Microbacterium sp. KSW4-11]
MSMELAALAHPSHGRILDIIRAAGSISRVEIAQESGMTGASVTNIVRLLLDLELIKEIGHAESTGGKRRTLLSIAPESRYAVGIHLQRENTTFIVSDMAGRLVGRRRTTSGSFDDPSALVRALAVDISETLDDLGIRIALVVGVGIATSRAIHEQMQAADVLAPQLSTMISLPVIIDREAIAAGVGEFWQGSLAQPSSFVTLYMGDEFGVGILNAGAVWRGASSNSGEIGHLAFGNSTTPCRCGGRGCLQATAAPEAVVAAAATAGLTTDEHGASSSDRFDTLARSAVRGDEAASAFLSSAADEVAHATVVLAGILDVEMVVLAGPGFAIPGAIYATPIRAALDGFCNRQGREPISVELAHNPRDTAAVGASALVLQRALAPRG